jgi:threonine/homoserine/homoserine lactone efflux protein
MDHPDQYRLIVFATALAFNLSGDISKVLLANRIRARLTPHNIHLINRISGAVLIVFAIVIVVTMFLRSSVSSQV